MTQAQIAIRAAKNFTNWGRVATQKFVTNQGCPLRLYHLARQLEAVKDFDLRSLK
jgi:hypothetical protein